MSAFMEALQSNDIENIRKCPKSDLHNHFVLGGNRNYIKQMTGIEIHPITKPLLSLKEMDTWSAKYIGSKFNSSEMRRITLIGDKKIWN